MKKKINSNLFLFVFQMDTHRRRSSHNSQAAQPNPKSAETAENHLAYEASQSPSPNGIYSGVDLARLTAGHQQQHLAAVAVKQQLPAEISNSEEKVPSPLPTCT